MTCIRKYLIYTFGLLLGASVLAGCSAGGDDTLTGGVDSDDTGLTDGTPVEVSFSLASRAVNQAASRADGTPVNPTGDNERIKRWTLVFVDRNGVIGRVVSREDVTTSTVAVEQESFKCIVPSGTYNIYAFANTDIAEVASHTGVTFTEGATVETTAIENLKWQITESTLPDELNESIPMSGFLKGVKVTNRIDEPFEIEVVRMFAKIEFEFTNTNTSAISINELTIDPVTTGAISLFPRGASGLGYSHLGNSSFAPLADATYAPFIYKPASPLTIEAGATASTLFYMPEAFSTYPNGHAFTIGVNVTHEDSRISQLQTNITHDITDYINRNDYVVIPISLSRYDVKIDALFYPPIGGYPALLSSVDGEGSQVFSFGTQGEFSIVPVVMDKIEGIHLTPQRYTIEIQRISNSSIFSKTPAIVRDSDTLPDEIRGTLNTSEGRAEITLKVDIYDPAADGIEPQLYCSYVRTIYIVRDNNVTE